MRYYAQFVLLVVFFFCFTTYAIAINHRLEHVKSWSFAIGAGDLEKLQEPSAQLLIVDGEEVTAPTIRRLHRHHHLVLGYLSVGTIEKNRSWFNSVSPYRLQLWSDWGEWYADVKQPGYQQSITRVGKSLLRKGLDGLFLDNFDMIETHQQESRGMRQLVKRLSIITHRRHGLLFMQNGDAVIDPFIPYLDGWNREDLSFTYNFSRQSYRQVSPDEQMSAATTIKHLKKRGLFITSTDYTAGGSSEENSSKAFACQLGALPYISDIELTRLPNKPYHC